MEITLCWSLADVLLVNEGSSSESSVGLRLDGEARLFRFTDVGFASDLVPRF